MFLLNSVLVSIFTFLLMFGDSHNRRKGALYVDNGYDQTEIEDMSLEENNRMELEMLSILGLDSTPLRSRSHSNNDPIGSPTVPKFRTFNDVDNFEKLKNTDSRTKLASKFLLDLYDSLMEEDDELSRRQRALEHNLNEDEQFAIDVSDVIMTFDNIDDESTNARPEKGKRLWFDFSKLSTTGTVIGGELRVYQNKLNAQRRNKTVYTVIVYELVYKYSGESSLERISSVSTTQSFSGWLGINLTDSLISWVRLFDYSKGLYLAVHLGDKPGHEIMPEEIGISVVNNGEGTQPFMVAFLEALDDDVRRR
ncbi:hypothetical protein GEV33_006501 [Tenebrio molitor]|uniref:TGF-beta propeptide domain-containing protein n=1 Tax=Tenebrio molitor TaxID=7067 RepID=A0A8J6LD57_TENMO|nr:hypothetical protein GEV33_006501 [Tenebrio molitor]